MSYEFKYEHFTPINEHYFGAYRNGELSGYAQAKIDGYEAIVHSLIFVDPVSDHVKINLFKFMERELYKKGVAVIFFTCPIEQVDIFVKKNEYKPIETLLRKELVDDPGDTRTDGDCIQGDN